MQNFRPLLILLPVVLALLVLFSLIAPETPTTQPTEVAYTEFKRDLRDARIASVVVEGQKIEAQMHAPNEEPGATVTTYLPEFGDPELLPLLEAQDVRVEVREVVENGAAVWLVALLPWVIILGIWFLIWRRFAGGGAGGLGGRDIKDFLGGSATKETAGPIKVRFADVAGQENAKREVAELVEYLRQPQKYTALGAEVPHGVLLVGPPGTGKTLLARALAGEAGVPFFHISASEFIEVFVGVGASRVRKMFDEAKKRAPCIIFMDELDSVGRVRGTGFGGGHDEREQTLNQILAEMDGFSGHETVIVLAATNRPDVLDPALLRPGRFDRHVSLELPDRNARTQILRVHTRHVPVAEDVDLATVAAGTPGFSGADLKNLVNEAAMAAARTGEKAVAMRHFEQMRDRILLGTVRTLAIKPEERHRLAVHESGHTAVAYYLPESDPPYKVTIIPHGRALGGMQQLPEEERHTLTEAYLRDRLAVTLAGRAAEHLFLDSISSGAEDDIRVATQLARAMVGRWGMSEEIGPIDVRESDEHPFLGREIAQPRHFSEATAEAADTAVRKLLKEAECRATEVLKAHRGAFEKLVAELEAKETLERPRIKDCLDSGAATAGTEPAATACA